MSQTSNPQQPSSGSGGTPANTSSSSGSGGIGQQQFETRITQMDQAYTDATAEISTALSKLAGFQSAIQSGQSVTWSQVETVTQGLNRALGRIATARQSLPVSVTA